MKQIRNNVFETNSSSTHSLTICSKLDYDAWKMGKLYLNEQWQSKNKKFITKEEALEILETDKYNSLKDVNTNDDDELEECFAENDIYSYDKYERDLEWYDGTYTTASGEEVIAFGWFGYNG